MEKDIKEMTEEEYKEYELKRIPDMKTTELLDWEIHEHFKGYDVLEGDIEFNDGGVFYELRKRWPFYEIYEKLDDLEKSIKGMQVAIDKLKRHKHDPNDGEVMVKL